MLLGQELVSYVDISLRGAPTEIEEKFVYLYLLPACQREFDKENMST